MGVVYGKDRVMSEECECCECGCCDSTWLDKAERFVDNVIRVAWLIVLYLAIFHDRFIVHVLHTLGK